MAKNAKAAKAKSAKADKSSGASVESEARKYELMLILQPELRESEVKKKLKEVVETVEKADGKILVEDVWGKREFAYRIKGLSEGIYAVYHLELPSGFLVEFKEFLRLEKEVVRSMLLSVDEDAEYTKYDWEAAKERPNLKRDRKTGGSPRQNPVAVAPVKKDEAVQEVKDKGQEAKESELDKKLDEIIGGEDLNP